MTLPNQRQPHASFDVVSRRLKAKKIELLVSELADLEGARLLEVGTGSGVIAAHFAGRVGPGGEVWGVDVLDQRIVREGYAFRLVSGTALPFDDGYFDVVVSNLVIEHVGGHDDQLRHLCEIARVLSDRGVAYVAAPSRWGVVEPHFHLPFVTWLPTSLRSRYVRLARRGDCYDCTPLTVTRLKTMLCEAGLAPHERTVEAMRLVAQLEAPSRLVRLLFRLPDRVLRVLLPVVPTMIFTARHRHMQQADGALAGERVGDMPRNTKA